jgi:hypothetical protein
LSFSLWRDVAISLKTATLAAKHGAGEYLAHSR